MSRFRSRFISAMVVVPSLFAGVLVAQEPGQLQQIRDWAAELIRCDSETLFSSTPSVSEDASQSLPKQFLQKGQQFLVQVGDLIEQEVGWLRPNTIKEQALVWIAIAMALPWGFMSLLRPLLKHDILIIRWIVVGGWTGLALWLAWCSWGVASGTDRFVSTMLFGVPMMVVYFNSIARSVADPAKV